MKNIKINKYSVFTFFFGILISSCFSLFLFSKANASPKEGNLTQKASEFEYTKQADSYADLVETLMPSVVKVSSTLSTKEGSDPLEDEANELFKYFFGGQSHGSQPKEQKKKKSLAQGSGFIVKNDFIVTNFHVIKDADKVTIQTIDGKEYEAKIAGTDPKTDLAVLKLVTKQNLPFVNFGSSSSLRVGDKVIAIGNPFGLGGTVTAGIISAKSRKIGSSRYEDFLQTDAAINKGNSGGPMFNLKGEVVGINTAIFTNNGGSVGIGFAIPSDMAKSIIEKLSTGQKIKRSIIGVIIQPVTKEISDAVGMKEPYGALVNSVVKDGPADKAGIKIGDIILEVEGKKIDSSDALPVVIGDAKVGSTLKLTILRNQKNIELKVTTKEQQDEQPQEPKQEEKSVSGFFVKNITLEEKSRLLIPADKTGVVVYDVEYELSDKFFKGDVIVQINTTQVASTDEFKKAVSLSKSKTSLIYLYRQGNLIIQGHAFK